MKLLNYGMLICGTAVIALSIKDLVKLIRAYIKLKEEKKMCADKTKAWLKGYLVGDKKFARYLKREDPELFRKIESF